jgi:hypothetical protein
MLDLFSFHNVKVSAKGLTKTSSYEIEEAGPLAVWGNLVEGNLLALDRMMVNVRVYPLLLAFGQSFKKGNHKSNFVHISLKGTPVIV